MNKPSRLYTAMFGVSVFVTAAVAIFENRIHQEFLLSDHGLERQYFPPDYPVRPIVTHVSSSPGLTGL